jgi:hypothetical protein
VIRVYFEALASAMGAERVQGGREWEGRARGTYKETLTRDVKGNVDKCRWEDFEVIAALECDGLLSRTR